MIEFQFEFEYVNIDVENFERVLVKKVNALIRAAAYAFLQAAAQKVRVRTGFAHGGFGPLATALGSTLPAGIPGTTPRPKEYYYGSGSKILKTPAAGGTFGTPIANIFKVNADQTIEFNYNINISYFYANDVTGSPRVASSPWGAYRDGIIAFNQYIRQNSGDIIPDIDDWIKISKTNI